MQNSTREMRVLIWPGGTEIGLEINRSLRGCRNVTLFAAGSENADHAFYAFKRLSHLPHVTDAGWLPALKKLLVEYEITHIYPAHDDVILALSRERNQFQATVVTSPTGTCEIARFKSKTYAALAGVISTPKCFGLNADVPVFPIFVKPDKGQGSFGAKRVDDLPALLEHQRSHVDLIAMEYLPGEEFTIDCFSDREAGLLFAQARRRSRMRSGISMNSAVVQDERILEIARRISSVLEFHGAWFFQMKSRANGELVLLEAAPRIAGTMALNRVRGVNFPLLSLYEQDRVPVSILTNSLDVRIDRALVNRYTHNLKFRSAYIDFDDTLLCNGSINCELVQLLYQFVNCGIRIVLLTRHAGDIQAKLCQVRMANLFDEVIQITSDVRKSSMIKCRDAILIDDSFRERLDVSTTLKIPTFDLSMIEMLFDWRA